MASDNGAVKGQTSDGASFAPSSPSKRRLENGAEAPAAQATSATSHLPDAPASENAEHRQKRPRVAAEANAAELSEGSILPAKREKIPGVALIKEEYLIKESNRRDEAEVDDDAAEGRGADEGGRGGESAGGRKSKNKRKGGQNKERDFGHSRDAARLCASVAHSPEFSPKVCRLGEKCRALHDLRAYLKEGRRGDLETFGGKCPVFTTYGRCPSGWKCRFVSSHMKEVEHADGRKELVLVEEKQPRSAKTGAADGDSSNGDKKAEGGDEAAQAEGFEDDARPGVVNVVSALEKQNLTRRRANLERSEQYIKFLDNELAIVKKIYNQSSSSSSSSNNKKKEEHADGGAEGKDGGEGVGEDKPNGAAPPHEKPQPRETASAEDYRAQFVDPPFLPSEKRRIYFGPETPTLAPLTTQGNLPFRRLCVELGCQVTYSEMALGVDLLHGKQPEWALMKAHESEVTPPLFAPGANQYVMPGYDNSRDLKFGAQIAANQPWMAIKATEAMTRLLPHLRLVDMNCGCPIDMVFKTGGGSGLLEAHNKLERMVRGMNAVSGEVPITAKLRIGVRDGSPLAPKVIERLAFGSLETRDRLGAPGCAAITLHGRTRTQRYRKPADWGYIAECAALVRSYNAQRAALADTVREPDPRTQANTAGSGSGAGGAGAGGQHIYFLGNGDCFSHVQYNEQIEQAGVDAVMIGRGAIIKPWLFEEIQAGQYLDKSATERLAYIEKYARYGMEAWGTDEMGLGTTRRFLLEFLSFASRYVPVGLLEYLPPSLNDRPPAFRGRNELETLLASRNYKDWIKISEMFLGPAHPDFKFVPKHKSNSYEMEAEG